MRVKLPAEEVKKLAKMLANVPSPSRTTMPILNSVKLTASKDKIVVVATNLNVWRELIVNAEVIEPGVAVVDAGMLRKLLPSVDGEVNLFAPNSVESYGRAIISGGSWTYYLPLFPVDEFPSFEPTEAWGATIAIDERVWVEGLERAMIAVSNETAYGLNGVRVASKNGVLGFVGTNTHILSLVRYEDTGLPDFAFTIPLTEVKKLITLLRGADSLTESATTLRVTPENNVVEFACNGDKIVFTALNNPYPDYERVVRENNTPPYLLTVEKQPLLKALRRFGVFRPTNKRVPLRIVLNLSPNQLTMEAWEWDYGELTVIGREEFPGDWLSGEQASFKIAFQHAYLQTMVTGVKDNVFVLGIRDPQSPAVAYELSSTIWRFLIMPMTLPAETTTNADE